MSCQMCLCAEEECVNINDETWLVRNCIRTGGHVDDDDTCPYDTSTKRGMKKYEARRQSLDN